MDRSKSIDHARLSTFIGGLVAVSTGVILVGIITDIQVVDLAVLYLFSPAIAAMIVLWRSDIPRGVLGLRIGRPRWLIVSVLIVFPLLFAGIFLAILIPDIAFRPRANPIPNMSLPGAIPPIVVFPIASVVGGVTVSASIALGEELGWRGYVLWELAPLGFWPASTLIGLGWGFWYAPIVFAGYDFPGFPFLGILVMTLACLSFAPLYTYLVVRAQSVLAVASFHGVFNASGSAIMLYTRVDSPILDQIVASPVGIAGMLPFVLVSFLIALRGAPVLSRSQLTNPE